MAGQMHISVKISTDKTSTTIFTFSDLNGLHVRSNFPFVFLKFSKNIDRIDIAGHIKFTVDDETVGIIRPDEEGFWKIGRFPNNLENPWKQQGQNSKMAPFDQPVRAYFVNYVCLSFSSFCTPANFHLYVHFIVLPHN